MTELRDRDLEQIAAGLGKDRGKGQVPGTNIVIVSNNNNNQK